MRCAVALLALAVVACEPGRAPAADSGIPQRDADSVARFELCEGCVIGCTEAGVRCVPLEPTTVGCDLCWPFCAYIVSGPGPIAECNEGAPICYADAGSGARFPLDVAGQPTCYRDLAR